MKRFFWVGLFSILITVFGFSDFARAADLTEKDCSSLGGYWRSESARPKRNDPKVCQFENEDGSYKTVKTQKDIPDTILVRNMDCPSGFTSNGSSGDALICLKKGGKSEEESKKPKVSIEDQIKAIKDDPKYKNVDWDYVRRICNGQNGAAGPDNDCVQKTADHVLTMNGGDYLNCDLEENKDKKECQKKDQNSCDINWIGFVVCPGARIGTAVVINIYHWIAQNLLQIESKKLFSESPETFKYWNEFRKIANVIFAVVIAVVVFSQVTNVGISNYGIKRMLPRIIIFAILTNISYWLVAALVDLSNIVGQALYMWLGASGNWTAADPNSKDGGLGSLVDGILSGTLEAGAGIAALGVMAATIGGGSILAVLLIAALALLTMFIILTARQAIVIMLVVVSPVAVVSSVLPNTDGFYKKWKSLLKSMLMIYPICSMMMGGMILASNVLYAASDNYLFKVVFGLLPMFGLFATAAVIKSVASMLDGITGTKTFSGALGKLDGAREKARDNRFTRAENRHWKDKLSDSEEKLRARKPNSKRLAILDGARRFKSRVDSRATSLKNENARLQQDYQLGALEQLSNAGKLDPNLEATRATLSAQKEKDRDVRTSIESNHLARNIISKAAVSGKSDPYATEFRDEINKLQGDDVNGENLELFMKAIDGTSQLSAAQKVELSRLLLSKYSSTDMVKYQDSIRRIQPIGKKYEDSHPEFHAEVKKGFETAASGTGSFVLTGREKGKVYSSFKPEKFKHLNNQSIKEIQNYYAATGDPNLKLAAQAALSPNSGLGGKLNAEQLAAVQALAR